MGTEFSPEFADNMPPNDSLKVKSFQADNNSSSSLRKDGSSSTQMRATAGFGAGGLTPDMLNTLSQNTSNISKGSHSKEANEF